MRNLWMTISSPEMTASAKKMKNLSPEWLHTLLTDKFFNACISHEEFPKNETNFYCVNCCATLCSYCLPSHRGHSHHLLQIRRYMYNYVIRLDAATQLIDCSSVQSYINNGAKVLFLKERPRSSQPQLRQHRAASGSGTAKLCRTCSNTLQDHYLYCSISCKIEHVLETEGDVSKYLRSCKVLTTTLSPSDDALITSVDSSGSSDTVLSTAFGAINFTVKKKRRSTARDTTPPPPPSAFEVEPTTAPIRPCRAWRKQSVPRRAPMV